MTLRRVVLLAVAVGVVAAAAPALASAAPPAGVTAIAFDGRADLSWQPVVGASAYTVYRGLTPSTVTTQVTPTGGVVTPGFADTGAVNGTTYYYVARAVIAGAESADSVTVQATPSARSCSAGNPVVLENCYGGTTAWNTGTSVSLAGGGIEGFATASSVNRGSSFGVKLQTAVATTASIEIYRGGWYGGGGARLISVVRGIPVGPQPACTSTASTGLYDCSNWTSGATITTSSSWPSGVYLLRLVRGDNGLDYEFPVVVRDDASHSALLYGLPFTTYQAYNNYGGKSLYGYNSTGADTVANSARAVKVSFDRPYVQPRDATIPNWYARADYPTISWLERSGYDVTYSGSDDLESGGALVKNHKSFISGAHDEYYSAAMRSSLVGARDAGTSLFVSGANAVFWKIRFENSGRTEVCYKTTESGAADPVSPTTLWRDPNGANQPENALIGQMYTGDQDSSFYPLVVSAAEGADRIWRYTGLDAQAPGTSTSIGTQLVGWEWDKRFANGFEPSGVKTLATSPVTGNILNAPTGGYIIGTTSSHVTRYVAASGALVFDTGTNHWGRGLALTAAGQGQPDVRIRQATTNVLADMGATPSTPAADITLDSSTAPHVVSTSPGDGGTAPTTTTVRATFSAAMNAATITATSFTLKRPDGSTVPATVAYDAGTLTATLTPSSALVSGTAYAARIDATVTSVTGTPLQSAASWTFTTAAFFVTSTTPADGAQSALQDTDVTATFSAAVATATLTTSSFWLTDSSGATIPAALSYDSATTTAKLRPNAPLAAGALYSAHVAASVTATDGTPLPAPHTWSFRTNACPCALFSSDPAPDLQHLSTANGRSGGPWSLELGVKIRVDQPTRLSAVRFYKDTLETGSHIARVWDAAGVQVAQVSFVGETASGWQRQTFPAPPLLVAGVVYTVSVNANANFGQTFGALAAQIDSGPLHSVADGQNGVFGDAAGSFPTQSFNSSSYFVDAEVVPDGEFLPIAVASTAPAAANGISPDVHVRATFTRSVDPATLTASTFFITAPDSTTVPGTIAYDDASLTARLLPSAPLALGMTYTVRLTTGIKSTTGSPLSAPVTFSFTTAATAPAPLTVDSTLPTAGASDIGASVHPRAHFSKPLDAFSIDAAAFTLTGPAGAVQANVSYDAASQNATLVPQAPLTLGATYTAHAAATIEATDGTRLDGSGYSWTFTVAATSPGGPTVTGTSPATGATSVALASSLSATFSISLDPTSISGTTFTANRTDGAGTVTGTVSYDSATRTARLVPSAPLAPSADYFARLDASVKAADGTPMAAAYGWSFSTTSCPCAFYFDSDTPSYSGLSTINGDGQGSVTLELGVKVAVDEPMLMTAFRFYKSPGETGTHVGRLWTAGGVQLAQQTFASETASGWQQQALTTPVELLPGAVYVVSVNANEYFVQTLDALQSSIIAGPLRTVPDGANAVYGSAAGTFPNQTFRTSSYYIDLQTVVEGTPAAPTVNATVPLAGATAAPPTSTVRATFSRPMLPTKLDALAFTLTRVSDSTNVSGVVTYDDATNTAILTPTVALAIGQAYTARVSTAAKARDGVPLAAPVSWTFTVASPPTVTAKAPADGATGVARNATVQVTFSKPIDITTLSGITLSGPSGAISAPATYNPATNTVTLTPTALLAVSTTYTANVATTVKAADGSAVASPVTWSFTTTADGTAPTVTITGGPTGTVSTSAASFAFSANESGSTFECAVDGFAFVACSSPDNLAGLADGTHTFSVRATDTAGNTGAAVTRTWTIDTSAPGGDGAPPDEGGGPAPLVTSGPTGFTSSTTATFVFSANEPATFTCTLGASTGPCTSPKTYTGLTEGAKTFTIVATDAAGNSSAPETHSWTIDLTAPSTTASCNSAACSAGWYTTSPVNVTLAATDSASGVDHVLYSTDGSAPSLTYTGPIAVTATTTVRFAAVDHVGNVEATKSQLVQVDTSAPTAPTLAFSALTNASATSSTVYFRPGSAGGFTVAGSSIDAQSGVASYGYASLGTGWSGTGGVYSFTAAAVDPVEPLNVTATNGAGLTSAATSFTVTPDSGAPASTVQCNGAACSAGWYTTSPVSVTLAASDSASGVDHILYSTDGSAPSLTYSGAISVTSTATVRFAAVDKVGNVEATKSQLVQVDTTAPTAPTLAFSAFTNASATGSTVYFRPGAAGGVTVAGSSTDAQSGVASYGYPTLGSGWSGTSGVYTFTAAAADPVEPLNVTATNGAGLTSTATPFTVTPDATAPVSSVQCNGAACSAGWYTSAPVSVSLAATDAGSGVAQIRYTTNGSDPSPVNGTTYAGAFAVGATTTVKFRAYDNVGNEEAVGSLLIRVDTSAPSAPALSFTGFTNASATGSTVYVRSGVGGGFTVSGSSTDAESGVASYGYPSLGSGWSGTGGVYAFTPAAVDPVEPLDVTATNNAGLTSVATPFTVTQDGTAPASTVQCGAEACSAGWYTSSPVSVSLAATDSGSGVERILYSTDGSAPSLTYGGAIAVATTTTIKFAAVDKVGNVESTHTQLVQVDTTAPTAPALAFSGFSNASATGSTVYFRPGAAGGFTAAGSSTDAESGVASYAYPGLGSGWSATGGAYSFTAAAADPAEPLNVTATNGAGLTSSATGFTVTADASAPASTVVCNGGPCAAGWYSTSPVSVTLTASDAGSGLDRILYSTDGSAPSLTYSGAISLASTATVRFAAVDKVGNVEATRSQLVQIDTTPPSAPALSFSALTNASVSGSTVYFRTGAAGGFTAGASSTDGGSGVASYAFPGLGSGWSGSGGAYSFTTAAVDPAEPLDVTATDVAGNTSAATGFTVTADGSAPASTATCNGGPCSSGWYGASPVSVTLAATDLGSGVDRILYSTDGSAPSTTYSGAISVASTATVRFAAVDKVGNVEATRSQLVQIDTSAPSAPSLAFSALTNASATGSTVYFRTGAAGGFTVTGSSVDGESGVASYAYPSLGSGWSGGGAYTFSAAAVDPVEPLNVTATNNAGLTSATTGFTVTSDGSAPATTAACNGGACSSGWYSSSPVSVSLAATDSGSGVDRILYSTDGSAPSLTYSGALAIATTTTVKFAAVDKVGNVESTHSQLVQIDTVAPSAPSLAFSAFTNASATGSTLYFRTGASGGFTVAGSSTDSGSGVASYAYPSLGSGWSGSGAYTFNSGAADPTEPLHVTATDVAGNTSAATGFTVTADGSAPASTVACNGGACSSGWYSSSPVSVSLAATDSGSGVDRILYSTDGSAPSLTYSGALAVATTTTIKFAA
ncbi:MAG TPA: Ig-like domain-containing protein, partial [Gaiellaceae bacterium]